MTRTIELPEDLALHLTELLPETEIASFVASVVREELRRQEEEDARILAAAFPDYNPVLEPERNDAECRAIIEAELADPDFLKNTISFEEMRRRAEETFAALTAGKKPCAMPTAQKTNSCSTQSVPAKLQAAT